MASTSVRTGNARTNGMMPQGPDNNAGKSGTGGVAQNGRMPSGDKGENNGTKYRGPRSSGPGISAKGIKSGKVT